MAVNLPDGSSCSDGKAWTIGDSCQKGKCEPSLDTKYCKQTSDCQDDGDLCNGVPFCNKATGVCQVNPGTVVVCPTADSTPCRASVCGAKTGVCVLTPKNELKACEDGNLCTTGEACVGGVCTASQGGDTCLCKQDSDCGKFEDGDACNGTLFCNLGKQKCEVNPKSVVVCPTVGDGPCATNQCSKASGKCALVATVGKVFCDADGSACTPVDLCSGGTCVADSANVCQCEQDGQCQDDGDKCNGVLYCDKAANVCKVNPATVVVCPVGSADGCVKSVCAAQLGSCATVTVGGPCSDGDACTVGDACAGGACKAGEYTCGACKGAGDCDDKSACTDDACVGQPLACVHSNNTAACSDGEACTSGDVCAGGSCEGKPLVCDDQEPCTSDACQGGTCVFLAANAATCTDGDACTAGDFCLNKLCKAGQGKADCDDKVACTADSCDVFKGCLHVAGVCGDGNGCTADSCDLAKGCVFSPNSATCSDSNACTAGDKCVGGACLSGAVTVCDDGNACTSDGCDTAKGCGHVASTASCSDSNVCTVADKCDGGVCLAGVVTACDDGNGCTAESCDPVKGCVSVPANVGKPCVSDGDVCTTDACDAKGVCGHAAKGKVCGDGLCCAGETGGDCPKDCDPCGDGVCDGDETVPNCPKDCGFLAKRLGATCSKPGAVDTCGDSFVCVDRSFAGGVPVCVADFATWPLIGDSHPVSDFVEATDYVTDSKTGLLWAKEALPAQNWASALGACNSKTYGGFKDWRLPVKDELRSLIDFGKQQPACSAQGLSIPSDQWYYWSATPWVGGGSAWYVYFYSGSSNYSGTSATYRVRCVR